MSNLKLLLVFMLIFNINGQKSIITDLSFQQCSWNHLCVNQDQQECVYQYLNQTISLKFPYVVIFQRAISFTCFLSIENIYGSPVAVQFYFVPNKDYGRFGSVAMRFGMDLKVVDYTNNLSWLHFNFSDNSFQKYESGRIWPDFEILSWWWGGPDEHPALIVIQDIIIK